MKNYNYRWIKFKDIRIGAASEFVLQSVSNIDAGTAIRRKVNYIGTDGCEYKDILYSERMFEISGFIHGYDQASMLRGKRRLSAACSLKEKFRMQYYNREKIYSAECYFDKLPEFSDRKQWILPFRLFVTIPGFYWESATENYIDIFGYKDEVIDTFTLPCVFSSLTTSKVVSNLGDVPVLPEFVIRCDKSITDSNIVIANADSGETIIVNYSPTSGEVITIDTKNQTVTSNLNGNITDKLTLDTEFFSLPVGTVNINAESAGSTVTLKFREQFIGV